MHVFDARKVSEGSVLPCLDWIAEEVCAALQQYELYVTLKTC